MVDLLIERGFSVTVIDNLSRGRLDNLAQHRGDPRCQVHQVDATSLASDSELFRGARYVFHFAGLGDIVPSIEHPLEYMHANVDGTLAVLEAARHANVEKLAYAASSSCYGAAPPVPTTELAPIKPEYPMR
jgi:UDP-glucose 4-epimerase